MSRIIKFVKDKNGNVLLYRTHDNSLIISFNPAQNVVGVPSIPNMFKIQSEASFGTNPFILDYSQVNIELCEPPILSIDFNTFLIELAKKFFYSSCCKNTCILSIPYTYLNQESSNAPIGGSTI